MPSETGLAAALCYAARCWPVFPWGARGDRRWPLTEHALLDATTDIETIRQWSRSWPDAVWAIATGKPSGIVGLDVDLRPEYSGFDSLEELGVSVHPETPTAHTPHDGCHLLFRWPGHFVKTIAGKLGRGLDIRGDGGSLILPPAPGRRWDPHLGLDTPVAPMPAWMVIPEPPPPERPAGPAPLVQTSGLSPYAEGALDSACRRIISAPAGHQEMTLNEEAFAIGTLAGARAIPADFARRALKWAARNMASHNQSRPWRQADIDNKVDRSFRDGMQHPREGALG